MTRLADRLPEFPWDRLAPYAEVARGHDDGIVDLSVGTPVDPVPTAVAGGAGGGVGLAGLPAHRGHARAARGDQRVGRAHAARHGRPVRGAADRRLQGARRAAAGAARARRRRHRRGAGAGVPDVRRRRPRGRLRGRGVGLHARARPAAGVAGVGQLAVEPDRARASGRAPREGRGVGPRARRDRRERRVLPRARLGRRSGLGPRRARERRLVRRDPGRALAVEAVQPGRLPRRARARRRVRSSGRCSRRASTSGSWCRRPCRRRWSPRSATTRTWSSSASATRAAATTCSRRCSTPASRVEHSEAGLYLWASRGEPCWDTVAWLAERGILVAPGEFYGAAGAQPRAGRAHRDRRARRRRRPTASPDRRCRRSRCRACHSADSGPPWDALAARSVAFQAPGWSSATTQQARTSDSRTTRGRRVGRDPELPGWRAPARARARDGRQRRPRHLGAAEDDQCRDPRRRVRQHRVVHVGDHLHRRRRGDPALPRLPDRAAGRAARPSSRCPTCSSTASCRPRDQLADFEARIAGTPCCTRTCAGSSTASRATRTRCRCCRSRRQRAVDLLPGLARPVRPRAGRSRRAPARPRCRPSRPTPTRSRSASRSSTPTTR